MNPTNRKPSAAQRPPQQLNQPTRPARQFKPAVAQLKNAVSAQSVKQPVAPPVYRPQQAPRVLQTKSAPALNTQAGQAQRQPIAPPVYRPEAKKLVQPKAILQPRKSPTAPQAYRPEQKRIAQPKMSTAAPAHTPAKERPVYRAQPKHVKVQQGRAAQMKPMAKKAASSFPTREKTIQAMMSAFNAAKAYAFGNNIPDGVVERKVLGGGYGVGFKASTDEVVLYDADGILAHINIQVPGNVAENIILHTRTDKGEAGGQGHMMAMFPVALRVIQENYSAYAGISMVPAPGAATKGMISLISRLRSQVQPLAPLQGMGDARMFMGREFLEAADKAKAARKAEEEKGLRKKPADPQVFDSLSMLETATELNALREFESADPMGMHITGVTGQFAEQLVGAGSPALGAAGRPALLGGAFAWHKSAEQTQQGTLLMTLPMAAVPRLIAALPS